MRFIYTTELTPCFLLHFIFELLSIFLIMINIVKIELTNATENFLANVSSARNFFTN